MDGRGKPFMAKIRYKFITFREYETEAFAEYLEYKAAKGWFLTNIHQNGILRFEKGEPKKLNFCVAVLPGSSVSIVRRRAGNSSMEGHCGRSFIRRTKLWFLSRPTRRFGWRTREELHFPGERCWDSCLQSDYGCGCCLRS